MQFQIETDLKKERTKTNDHSNFNDRVFSQGYVDFLNQAGWRLERKLPSNSYHYSDLLEDTEWKSNDSSLKLLRHYRRDLDALS